MISQPFYQIRTAKAFRDLGVDFVAGRKKATVHQGWVRDLHLTLDGPGIRARTDRGDRSSCGGAANDCKRADAEWGRFFLALQKCQLGPIY